MEKNIDFYDRAVKIAEFLTSSKASDVVVLDLRESNIWTDYFVIATVSSPTHASGLENSLSEEIKNLGLDEWYTKRKNEQGAHWKLIDLGSIVIHLMSKMAREFYDLENLHSNAKQINF
ncbi:MAG: ribosome silencing factor [Treponema sp.]